MYPKMATNINLARKIPAILSMIIAYKTTNLTNENINLINSKYQTKKIPAILSRPRRFERLLCFPEQEPPPEDL